MNNLITLQNIQKSFKKDENQELLVLDNINFTIKEGEILAILGKSGSGKSTLLRIIAGLTQPTSGEVIYRGNIIHEPVPGIAMIFQNFALLPWLTVFQNVELGLEAQGIDSEERKTRTLKAIDTIGLDGFESAYPKELSGGMRQRVGIARALVVEPELLLMDEPFSALDVLTGDNLKSDLVNLWEDPKNKKNSILLVTHNIEEAVLMADRLLVVGANPGCIHGELTINMPHPRNEKDTRFRQYVDDVYTLMTTSPTEGIAPLPAAVKYKNIGISYRLPDAAISELSGLLEELNTPQNNGRMDLPKLAEILHLDIDDLFPLTEALEILRFATISKGDIELTAAGRNFAQVDILEKKLLFANHLIRFVPLASHIRRKLDERPNHRASKERFVAELEDYLSEEEAKRVLRVLIEWGRYAEIFAYDDNTGILSLDNPD